MQFHDYVLECTTVVTIMCLAIYCSLIFLTFNTILCSVYRASLYNLVNKANLVHNFSYYVYFFSVHVSGDYVPIISWNNCVFATLGTCYSVWMTVWYAGAYAPAYQTELFCVILCGWLSAMQEHMLLHTRQNSKYQVLQKYSSFSWWWAHSRLEHVEKINKHTKKYCTPSWLYLQDSTLCHLSYW